LGGWWLAAYLAAATPVAASSFTLTPVRVELGSTHSRAALTLHNDGDEPVTVQVGAVSWAQPSGSDQYAPTRELIVAPPVFVLAGKSDQIVRVALRREADATRELAYRLFFEEVPTSTAATGNGLHIALRIGVPVFVAPAAAKAAAALTWQARTDSAGKLQIEAANHGTAHLQVTDFEVQLGAQAHTIRAAGSRYVLPDSAVSWTLAPPEGFDSAAPLHLHGFSDQGEIVADIARVSP
jgi:fimbrial chaperone protein